MYIKPVMVVIYFCVIANANEYFNNIYLRIRRQSNTNGCLLPPHPSSGKWTIYGATSKLAPGESVPTTTILEVSCQHNFKLEGEDISTCVRGKWRPKMGKCLRVCPPINDTPWMSAICFYNDKQLDNCINTVEGAVAKFQCSKFYEDERHPFGICSKGRWSSLPECIPVCGKKSKTDPRLIIGGTKAKIKEYPWAIALYRTSDKELICGGSLLNERVILTAAHCVTDVDGNLLSKDSYFVAAGKYFRLFNDSRDVNETQFSFLSEIHIPRQYKGDLQNYFGDIAILVTEKIFVFTDRVQPVCIEWRSTRLKTVTSNKLEHGHVTGWGYTAEFKNPSEELRVLKVPLISQEVCTKQLFETKDIRLMTDDKLCAGFLNSSISVCKGDSGGGLTFQFGEKHYILAIVSISPQSNAAEGGCDSQQYTLYTNVSYYTENFILQKEIQFKPSVFGDLKCNFDINCKINALQNETETNPTIIPKQSDGSCILPNHPLFGYWMINGSYLDNMLPGDSVANGSILFVTCDKQYVLKGNNTLVCTNGKWSFVIGECYVPVKTTITLSDQRIPTNSTVRIPCVIEGYPKPLIEWYKNFIPINPNPRIQISEDHGLFISNITKADSGMYKCKAFNRFSTSSSLTTIFAVNDEIYVRSNCSDNRLFANCDLIVKAKFCGHKYYAGFCCKSCIEAGLLPIS